MNQFMADVSGIPDIKTGDIAVIIGRSDDGIITAYDIAAQTESITNECLSRLGERL